MKLIIPGGHLRNCSCHVFILKPCLKDVAMFPFAEYWESSPTQTKVLKVLRLISLRTRSSGAFTRDEQHSSGFLTGLASLPLHSTDFVHNKRIILFPALRCSSRVSPRSSPLPSVDQSHLHCCWPPSRNEFPLNSTETMLTGPYNFIYAE